ncbi:MAG: PAS domain S-box protein [Chloroflexi bacterium]|nr:PAS domain S-box protein [Chloroflexota bacterium]MBP8054369.1 PAS domain S-box protein [Chloroflexota bacterium]
MGKKIKPPTTSQAKQTTATTQANDPANGVVIFTEAMGKMPHSFTLSMALEQTIQALWQYTQAPAIALFSLDEQSDKLKLIAGRGFSPETVKVGQQLPVQGSLSGLAVMRRQIVTSEDMLNDERLAPSVKQALLQQGLQYAVSVPLLFQEQVVGVANLIFPQKPIMTNLDPTALYFMAQTMSAIMVGLHDVHELQQMQEAVSESEAQFRRLAESSPDYVFILDLRNFKTVYTNRDSFLGYGREEWRDRSVFDHVHPEDNEIVHTFFREFVDQLITGGVPTIEYRLETKEKQWEWVQHRGTLFTADESGKPLQVIIMLAIVTERKNAEMALRQSEERYRRLFEQSQDAIYVSTREGQILDFNQAALDMFGFTRDEVAHVSLPDLYPGPAERRRFQKAIEETGMVENFPVQLRNRQRELLDCLLTSAVVRDAEGQVTGYQGIIRDITEQKRLETQIKEDLERRGRQVGLSTQVAQEIASATNLNDLYQRVVEQVHEQFGFYYTQMLLFDATQDAVVMIHGYGDVGAKMLAARHKMPLGVGLIGVAAATGYSVLRPEVASDPHWKPNPLLPDTQGELAVPIKLKDKVLGVLDVQTNLAHQLTPEDQLVLEGLCGQIAIAIENTRLLEEANNFRQFAELSSQGMGFADLQAHVAYANPALIRMLGYASADEVVGHPVNLFYPEHLHPILTQQIQPTVMNGGQWTGEMTMRSVHGHLIPTYESFVLLYDQHGHPRYIADLITDMTDRKQAELDLQERLVELNNIQRYMSKEGWQTFHAAATDRPHGFIFDQRAVQPIHGNGHNGDNHAIPDDIPLTSQTNQTILSPLSIGGEIIGLLGIETDLNTPLTTDERSLLDEISIQVAGALENARLSEQTRVALAGQERLSAQLATVAEVSAIASTILEEEQLLQAVVDLTKIQFSLYHAQIFIYDENTQRLRLRAGSDQIGRLMVFEKYTLALNNNQSPAARAGLEFHAIREDDIVAKGIMGHPYLPDTKSQLSIPITQGERLLGVIDLHANTPSFFTTEDIRVYTTLSLQVAVALQNAYLYAEQLQTAEQLREVDRLKSEFLASMSHELRTPLNSIVGFADVLLEGLDGDLNERMEEDIHLIRQSGIHLRELISDILDMSKIEAGMMELRFEEINVREIAEEMMATNKPVAQTSKKHLDLQLEVSPEVTIIVADRTRLRQIFHNLISNAIKFTERGYVRVAVHKRDEELVVAVQDSGIGIRPEDVSIVFERFRQIDGSLTRQAGGTGLGMPITKELVELHGGRIWLESQIGEGTTFWFTIPMYHQVRKRETGTFR